MIRAEAAQMLGVTESATAAEVQHAFVRLARRTHPDTLQDADEHERRVAAERFDALVQARRLLLETPPGAGAPSPDPFAEQGWAPHPSDPAGPLWRPAPSRGLGGSLVVLVLLAFLLVALVSLDDAFRTHQFDPAPVPVPVITERP
jgi:DnaJ domain